MEESINQNDFFPFFLSNQFKHVLNFTNSFVLINF